MIGKIETRSNEATSERVIGYPYFQVKGLSNYYSSNISDICQVLQNIKKYRSLSWILNKFLYLLLYIYSPMTTERI